MAMVSCASCQGMVPAGVKVCPNCGAARGPSKLVASAVLLAASSAFGVTLMACYGTATCYSSDGGAVDCTSCDAVENANNLRCTGMDGGTDAGSTSSSLGGSSGGGASSLGGSSGGGGSSQGGSSGGGGSSQGGSSGGAGSSLGGSSTGGSSGAGASTSGTSI